MSGPSQYVREKREAAARRRLEIAKILRDDPSATNLALARALKVNRDTIAADRKIMVTELNAATLNETEQLRSPMVKRLESLNEELELHRKDGKLSVSVVHEMLLVNRSIIELLGVRKPVVEKLEVQKRTISFTTSVVSTETGRESAPKLCEVTSSRLALKAGDDETR